MDKKGTWSDVDKFPAEIEKQYWRLMQDASQEELSDMKEAAELTRARASGLILSLLTFYHTLLNEPRYRHRRSNCRQVICRLNPDLKNYFK